MSSPTNSGRRILVRKLANGVYIPAVSLGTWQLKTTEAEESVGTALKTGYYAVDDAWVYKNEEAVGAAVQKFNGDAAGPAPSVLSCEGCEVLKLDEFMENFAVPHGKPSDERRVFVTSKIWVDAFDREDMRAQMETHLKNFGRSSCDLMILHWPGQHKLFGKPAEDFERLAKKQNNDAYRATTWRNLEELYAEGKARAIGVSNYTVKHLTALLADIKARKEAGDEKATIPMYNQIEISPMNQPPAELEEYCKEHGIVIASYSTMGGAKAVEEFCKDPTLNEIANRHGKTVNNVILRWAMQRGYHVLPKSSKPDRVKSNWNVFDFQLTEEDMQAINKLHRGQINCGDPHDIN